MPASDLTQQEAQRLIDLPKRKTDVQVWDYPNAGEKVGIPIVSEDGREDFLLDLSRGSVDLTKGKFQNRARNVVVLLRLDFGHVLHRNPDDEEIVGPHLHIYREGYGDKWAFPVPGDLSDVFSDVDDPVQTWQDFLSYCNVVDPPDVKWRLVRV